MDSFDEILNSLQEIKDESFDESTDFDKIDLIEKIKNKEEIDIDKLNDSWLLFTDSDNKTILEYLIDYQYVNKKCWKDNIVKITSVKKAMIFYKKGLYLLLEKYVDDSILFSKVDGEKTLFDLLKDKMTSKIVNSKLNENVNLLNEIVKINRWDLVSYFNINFLMKTSIDGKSCLEILFEKDMIDGILDHDSIYLYDDCINKFIMLCNSYNKKDLLKKISGFQYNNSIFNGQLLLEYLLTNKLIDKEKISSFRNPKLLFELCKKYNSEYLLAYCNANAFVYELEDGQTILDYIFNNNIEIDSKILASAINYNKDCANKLLSTVIKNERYDVLLELNPNALIQQIDLNRTVLDVILEEFIRNKDIDISKISMYGDEEHTLKLIFAKHDLQDYLREYDIKKLLSECKDGKKVIEILLDTDIDLACKLIPKKVKRNMEIALILKAYGVEQSEVDIPLEKDDYSKEYLKEIQKGYHDAIISSEDEIILDEFRKIMSDGKSDPEYVETIIDSYRYLLSVNNPYGLRDLNYLIQIKKDNPNFSFVKINDGGFYSLTSKTVNVDSIAIPVFNHELGHAMHDMLADNFVPDQFQSLIDQLSKDPDVLKRFSEFAKMFSTIRNQYKELSKKTFESKFEEIFTDEKKKEIELQLNKDKESKLEEYRKLGYSEQVIKAIIDKEFSIDEYRKHYIRINSEELDSFMFYGKYSELSSLCDILDAIYDGKLYDKKIEEYDLSKFSLPGHGINYYYKKTDRKFSEMIANFAEIVKSPDSKKIIDQLTYIVGPELVSVLKDCYDNKFVLKNQKENTL